MPWNMALGRKEFAAIKKPDLFSNLKRDAKGNILRSELLRINKPVLCRLDERRRRTVVRWLRGRKYWNDWAKKMLKQRKELEKKGEWSAVEKIDPSKGFLSVEKGGNQSTKEWLIEAEADFSDLELVIATQVGFEEKRTEENEGIIKILIVEDIDFSELLFPSTAIFRNITFSGAAGFSRVIFYRTVLFENINFSDASVFQRVAFFTDVYLLDVIFSSIAIFDDAIFSGVTTFGHATFSDNAYFLGANFSGIAAFEHTTFSSAATFSRVTFSDKTYFRDATFSGEANFSGAIFSGDAIFRLATFKKPVNFSRARFRKDVDFSSIHSQKSFSLRDTRFYIAPDFSEAAFHAPLVLDDVRIEEQLRKRGGPLSFHSLPDVTRQKALDVSRRFRALGKMAHEVRDWLNEMEFFAQEIRTRRFGLDFPLGEWRGLRKGLAWLARKWRLKSLRIAALWLARRINASSYCGPRVGRFWFGWIYETLSRFGRSFVRPFVGWVITMFAFAMFYWLWAQKTASFGDLLAVSFRQGLVISGLVRSGHYQHLLTEVFGPVKDNQNIPDLPHCLFFWMNVQTVLSAFFLFLFFLAVRNHFRIR